jgi:hypothetical protein
VLHGRFGSPGGCPNRPAPLQYGKLSIPGITAHSLTASATRPDAGRTRIDGIAPVREVRVDHIEAGRPLVIGRRMVAADDGKRDEVERDASPHGR